MSLAVREISFKNFRNYAEFTLEGIGPLTIIVGPNAVGKTNIVEGIQLVTALSSHKNATAAQLLLWEAEQARVEAVLQDDKRDLEISLSIAEGKRQYSLNGKPKRPKDLRGLLPSVMFSPDDLALVKGAQSIKRATIDSLGVQLSQNYHVVKRDYEKIIQHKNRLLKEEHAKDVLDSINETLIRVGVQYYCYRNALFKKILPFVQSHYQDIVEERELLDVTLIPSWECAEYDKPRSFDSGKEDATAAFKKALEEKSYEERQRKRSLVGPHADRVEFFINGKNASVYGSQGQQRSIVLSYKLAEVSVIQEMTGQMPILLLDDVMSELDTRRREALIRFIGDDIQTVITTTNLEYFNDTIKEEAGIVMLGTGDNDG